MCLHTKCTAKEKREWLKTLPDIIPAYKVVRIKIIDGKDRLLPTRFDCSPIFFKRKNILKKITSKISVKQVYTIFDKSGKEVKYIAYYHLFMGKKDAERWSGENNNRKVIKCEVPKDAITEVGFQDGLAIVTRKFTIVGEDRYLE